MAKSLRTSFLQDHSFFVLASSARLDATSGSTTMGGEASPKRPVSAVNPACTVVSFLCAETLYQLAGNYPVPKLGIPHASDMQSSGAGERRGRGRERNEEGGGR